MKLIHVFFGVRQQFQLLISDLNLHVLLMMLFAKLMIFDAVKGACPASVSSLRVSINAKTLSIGCTGSNEYV